MHWLQPETNWPIQPKWIDDEILKSLKHAGNKALPSKKKDLID